ncbi:MAG: hypothetical protein JWQ98_1229 [Chlorobi bacterium]|nr:hypothetical protein [Chlorobiota bacterium]
MITMSHHLDISGYDGQAVPCTFFSHSAQADHLAIILPGLGYTSTMPLLYYATSLMVNRRADVLRLEYDYSSSDFRSLSPEVKGDHIAADISAAGTAALAVKEYRRITLIGKSLGTQGIARLLGSDPRFRDAVCIWLTPVLVSDDLRAATAYARDRSLFVIGTADPFYREDYLAEVLKNSNGKLLTIDGADHALEIDGDVIGSIEILRKVIGAMAEFIDGNGERRG